MKINDNDGVTFKFSSQIFAYSRFAQLVTIKVTLRTIFQLQYFLILLSSRCDMLKRIVCN